MKLTILNLIRNALHRAQAAKDRELMASAVAEAWPQTAKVVAEEAAEKCEHLENTYQFALETFLDETDDS